MYFLRLNYLSRGCVDGRDVNPHVLAYAGGLALVPAEITCLDCTGGQGIDSISVLASLNWAHSIQLTSKRPGVTLQNICLPED